MRLGITTTLPIEAIIAAGHVPVDLNNLLIGSHSPAALIAAAEKEGLPRNICAWVKGLYGVIRSGAVDAVVSVERGDCDTTTAMTRLLAHRGTEVIPFTYPERPDSARMSSRIEEFCARLDVSVSEAEEVFDGLAPVRRAALELESLYAEGPCGSAIDSATVHERLLSCSDFNGDPAEHLRTTRALISMAKGAAPTGAERRPALRVALTGVPPIFSDFFPVLERLGARIVLNETPRQFALPGGLRDDGQCADDPVSIAGAYSAYTYPYGPEVRARDLARLCAARRIDGVIHYVQAFCHRHIETPIISDALPYPSLVVEGDAPGAVDARTRMRIEAFLSSLRERVSA